MEFHKHVTTRSRRGAAPAAPGSGTAAPVRSARSRLLAGRSTWFAAGLAGALAAGVAIAVGEAMAGIIPGAPSLVIAIGDLVIDLQPPGAKDFMVSLFGTNDKLALNLIIVVVAVTIAAAVGIAGRGSWIKAVIGFSVAGAVALFAALREPLTTASLAVVTVIVSMAASLAVLRVLLAATRPEWAEAEVVSPWDDDSPGAAPSTPAGAPATAAVSSGSRPTGTWDRRNFLVMSGTVALGSVVVGSVGRYLLDHRPGGPPSSGPAAQLPPTGSPAPSLPGDASLNVPGITPIVMPNDQFYRIDTALLVPRVDASTWKLTIDGMVDTPVTLTYPQLQAMPLFDQYVTIACVSNEVGGNLVGNTRWTGVHLRSVLAMAGVQAGATQIVGHSVDDFTVGFPTEWAMDPSRDPMIALGMDGQPLPIEHGFPARLIIPGLYGYVSATKWLSRIELTTLDAFDAYWVQLGWAKEAPILTQSRIDVPKDGSGVSAGKVPIAGVAWAPDRGVSGVEVRVDNGAWQTAQISAAISRATWVQWLVPWDATSGDHTIEVRATDGTGTVQTADQTPPPPDGARGHHTITVHVS